MTTITQAPQIVQATTVALQSAEILSFLEEHREWLAADEDRTLRLKLPNGKGIGLQGFGAAVQVSPGFFDSEGQLLSYQLRGAEFIRPGDPEAQKAIARVLRRAAKLEG